MINSITKYKRLFEIIDYESKSNLAYEKVRNQSNWGRLTNFKGCFFCYLYQTIIQNQDSFSKRAEALRLAAQKCVHYHQIKGIAWLLLQKILNIQAAIAYIRTLTLYIYDLALRLRAFIEKGLHDMHIMMKTEVSVQAFVVMVLRAVSQAVISEVEEEPAVNNAKKPEDTPSSFKIKSLANLQPDQSGQNTKYLDAQLYKFDRPVNIMKNQTWYKNYKEVSFLNVQDQNKLMNAYLRCFCCRY